MESSSVKRRLTCILAADAVGYSKQMGHDEEGTIRVLQAHRSVIDGIITFHQGRIVSTAGDSVLAEFSSAVEAVRCAVEIQDALKTRNDSLPDHRKMLFRVGVNLGDVVVKNDDLLGDGVNVAARLESMAEPGGICIASSVYDQITGKLDLGFLDIGQQNLKNISRPIHVYRVSGSVLPIAASPPPTPTGTALPSTARSPLPWATTGFGVLAVGFLAAWQGGWLRFGEAPATEAVLVAAPTPTVPASATPLTMPVPKTVVSSAVTPASRQGQADAQRLLADARAIKRQAEAELAQARAAKAVSVAAPVAAPVVQATTPIEKPPQTSPIGVGRFNGRWKVTVDCPKHEDGAQGYRIDFVAEVVDGRLRGELGTPDSPGWLLLQGDIQPDGKALLYAKGLTADPRFSVQHVGKGTPFGYAVDAHFDGTHGSGRRTRLRACLLGFEKQ